MKKTHALVFSPLLLLAGLIWSEPEHLNHPAANDTAIDNVLYAAPTSSESYIPESFPDDAPEKDIKTGKSEEIVAYAMSLIGSPYIYAGISPDGFDCSGFITHVYGAYAVDVPHSSAMQAEEGMHVPQGKAQTGDLVIFTGTNAAIREPGHVGIVISSPGEPIEFVHASSNGGVKVSQVEGTGYDRRFLQVRRIL